MQIYPLHGGTVKIAFIVYEFPCLSETFILNQITGLLDRGHEVDIFAQRKGNYPTMHADVKDYRLLDRTFYLTMPESARWRFLKAIVMATMNFHKNPTAVLKSLNFRKFGGGDASLTLLHKVSPFLGKGPYAIVHCHFGPNGKLGILLKEIGVTQGKIITTFHGYDMSSYVKRHGSKTYARLFEKGDLFLPISERWKQELVKLGCSKNKIVVHRMGVDPHRFRFVRQKPRRSGTVKISTIARLVEKKGVQYGLQAVARILPKHPEIEYTIVGDGPLRDDIENLITRLNLRHTVKLVGRRTQEQIIALINDTDILLAPSVTSEDGDQEGIPVVLMEALAHGIPVLSTYHSGIPELVQEGVSGFLVPERDVDFLAKKLEYLLNHQEIWPRLGRAGREHIEKHYDIHKLNDQLVDIYMTQLDRT